jgi:hypothetical protein
LRALRCSDVDVPVEGGAAGSEVAVVLTALAGMDVPMACEADMMMSFFRTSD